MVGDLFKAYSPAIPSNYIENPKQLNYEGTHLGQHPSPQLLKN